MQQVERQNFRLPFFTAALQQTRLSSYFFHITALVVRKKICYDGKTKCKKQVAFCRLQKRRLSRTKGESML
ncbi:MAG: hypothetical protein ACLSWV_11700, partial [Pygmaiobacter massiliensis]